MLVSVIIPSYNSSKYLGDSILSALNQTYTNIEIIVIDDGSMDGSLQIAKDFCLIDSRIKVFQHAHGLNKGVSATRNLGICMSKGEYIALLDADDLWNSTKIEMQLRVFEEHGNVDLVYSQLETLFDIDVNYSFPSLCGSGEAGIQTGIFKKMLEDQIWMPNSSVIFKRKILDKVGLFKEGLKWQVEDHLFFTKTTYFYNSFYIRQVLGKYRIHKGSYTVRNKWQKSFYEFLFEMLNDKSIKEKRFVVNALIKRILDDITR